jgi:hypothetical protein
MITAARGDTRPCVREGCVGMMQFGREPVQSIGAVTTFAGVRGWVCSMTPEHFTATIWDTAGGRTRQGA